MTRAMLVCPEPLGHGQPAGIGIRFLEIARVLRGDGHDVTILSPDAGAIEGERKPGRNDSATPPATSSSGSGAPIHLPSAATAATASNRPSVTSIKSMGAG